MRELPRSVRVAYNILLDFVSERCCLLCRKRVRALGPSLCRSCARELLRQRVVAAVTPVAFADAADGLGVSGVWTAARYRGLVRESVVTYKFHARLSVLPLLVSLAAQRFRPLHRELRPDLIVPVPTTLVRYLWRGTDLPGVLARRLAARFGIPWSRVLARRPFGARQVSRSKEERLMLPARTFWVRRPRRLAGKRVLLVDDVLTTGGTVLVCAQALLKARAASVGILALAHG